MEPTNHNTHILSEKPCIRSVADNDEARIIEGYGAVYNHRSKLIFERGQVFYEVIEPGAFDEVLRAADLNVLATVNHKRDLMLGRNISGTLRLTSDEKGLRYEIDVPDTQLGKDTVVQVERGDFYESSFIYTVTRANIKWSEAEDGIPVRSISKVDGLFDVSIVTDGAFANTDVAAREYTEYEISQHLGEYSNLAAYKRRLRILKLKK